MPTVMTATAHYSYLDGCGAVTRWWLRAVAPGAMTVSTKRLGAAPAWRQSLGLGLRRGSSRPDSRTRWAAPSTIRQPLGARSWDSPPRSPARSVPRWCPRSQQPGCGKGEACPHCWRQEPLAMDVRSPWASVPNADDRTFPRTQPAALGSAARRRRLIWGSQVGDSLRPATSTPRMPSRDLTQERSAADKERHDQRCHRPGDQRQDG
jgi:hypothetical protein